MRPCWRLSQPIPQVIRWEHPAGHGALHLRGFCPLKQSEVPPWCGLFFSKCIALQPSTAKPGFQAIGSCGLRRIDSGAVPPAICCNTQATNLPGLRMSMCILQKQGNPLQAAVEEIWEIGHPGAQHTAVHAKLAAVFSCISTGAFPPQALSVLTSVTPAWQPLAHLHSVAPQTGNSMGSVFHGSEPSQGGRRY